MDFIRTIAVAVGSTMVAFGGNQLIKPSKWYRYLPNWLIERSPVSPASMMRLHGSGNVGIGLALISGLFQRRSLQVAAAWWAWVTPFCGRNDWRTAMRDGTIAVTLFALQSISSRSK